MNKKSNMESRARLDFLGLLMSITVMAFGVLFVNSQLSLIGLAGVFMNFMNLRDHEKEMKTCSKQIR